MTTASNPELVKEVFEYLRSKFEIPDNVVNLTLYLRLDNLVEIHCEYYPNKKESP